MSEDEKLVERLQGRANQGGYLPEITLMFEAATALTAAEARIRTLEAQIERVRNEAARCLPKMEMVGPNWLLEALSTGGNADDR